MSECQMGYGVSNLKLQKKAQYYNHKERFFVFCEFSNSKFKKVTQCQNTVIKL